MNMLKVTSEIGRLKTVMIHRPGGEIDNLTPKGLESLLFDDIPWLEKAVQEHDFFANILRQAGVKVLYLADLAAEALDTNLAVKTAFIRQFIAESRVTSETLAGVVTDYLMKIPSTKQMIEQTMAGIKKSEVPNFTVRTLTDHIRDYPFVTDPMPNLFFARDPFTIIDNGVAINKMFTATRARETIYGEYIFKYHPVYGNTERHFYDRDELSTIEGGDIIILSDKILAVGVSQRTHPAAIERLAKNVFYKYKTSFETILAFDIPKGRAFMHLDTVLTQVDFDKFAIHGELNHTVRTYEVTKDPKRDQKLLVKPIDHSLERVLEMYLGHNIILIPCGGNDVVAAAREQWNDGANILAIAPGEVISYERNHITNGILRRHGIIVHEIPSSELSRGRGGPRCMSMPFEREAISLGGTHED